MGDKGDPAKQPPECPKSPHYTGTKLSATFCPHIKETYAGFDGERWECERCGVSFFLDYEDMK